MARTDRSRSLDLGSLAAAVGHALEARPAPVVSVYLYGSYANGRAHRESDVDLAILLDPERMPSARERFEARVDLASALIAELHRNDLDLVVLNDLPPGLARAIITGGQRIYCVDAATDRAFARQVQLRAADLEPFLRRARAIKLARLRR